MSRHVDEYRRRLKARGLKRLEVCVPDSDATLIRRLAKALSDDQLSAVALRAAIDNALPSAKAKLQFKEWLMSLPDEE